MPRERLKPRKDGRYLVRYHGHKFYGKTQREAIAKREQYKLDEAQGFRGDSADLTFEEYSQKWIEVYKANVTPSSRYEYNLFIRKACTQLGWKRIRDISRTDIVNAYNWIVGASGSSCHKYCMLISSIMDAAVADGYALRNPCIGVKRPKGMNGTHRCLEEWEQLLVLQMANSGHRFAIAAALMMLTGMRRGEMLALNIDEDIDWEQDLVHVNKAIRFESNQPVLTSPKTEAGVRTIPLLPQLRSILQGRHGLVFGRDNSRFATETIFNEALKSYNYMLTKVHNDGVDRRWYGLTKEHLAMIQRGDPLPPYQEVRIRTHDFRHTFCTRLYDAGIDLKTAQRWMGHADEKMIFQIYAHLTAEHEARSRDQFAQYASESWLLHRPMLAAPASSLSKC